MKYLGDTQLKILNFMFLMYGGDSHRTRNKVPKVRYSTFIFKHLSKFL